MKKSLEQTFDRQKYMFSVISGGVDMEDRHGGARNEMIYSHVETFGPFHTDPIWKSQIR